MVDDYQQFYFSFFISNRMRVRIERAVLWASMFKGIMFPYSNIIALIIICGVGPPLQLLSNFNGHCHRTGYNDQGWTRLPLCLTETSSKSQSYMPMLPGDDHERSSQYPTTTARKCWVNYDALHSQQHTLLDYPWVHVYEEVKNTDRAVCAQSKNDLDCQYEIVSIFCLALRMRVHRYHKGTHSILLPCTGHSWLVQIGLQPKQLHCQYVVSGWTSPIPPISNGSDH